MRFRPCIDIHNGKVKQIVGGTLSDRGDQAAENFVSEKDAAFYADFYRKDGLAGGHIILLNPVSSPFYEATKEQALQALAAYPGGLQVGGGINDENAGEYLKAGASHVIVTSFVFQNGELNYRNLEKIVSAVGREHLVLDLSCRRRDGAYYIVTDRWQKFTEVMLDERTLDGLSSYCDEFLIHAVDVEGKARGIEEKLAAELGRWGKLPITYAGGVASFEDLVKLRELGQGHIDVTIGSALDLFGGNLPYKEVLKRCCSDRD
ncbi:MAG: phosphoribosylformimino-5-aminoimidazole carboxamide ribotide isomerase [Lachnospiraceae bacterium]|jgi:phosphoribosylformimino-5-aminoimidazole carboxamide ribotide isomerase|nr:phosphoribosylformimino-5-aminoimidazole carboxamide ribotide isomerase [Lachnospiraceae bacterium]